MHGRLTEPSCANDPSQVAIENGYASTLYCDVRSRTHGNTHVRSSKGRRIVNPVSGHYHHTPFLFELTDKRTLSIRQSLRINLRDAELARYGIRRVPAIARERELGTFEQLLVAPLSVFEILAGKTGGALLIGTAMSSTMALAGVLILGVPFEGSAVLLLASIVVFLASVIGVGLFVSTVSATQQQAIIGCYLFMAPAIMLSGYTAPIENMPDWLQMVSLAYPVRHFIVISRGIFLKGLPVNIVLDHLWPMALIALVTLSAAASMFRNKFS
jgi:hypothetical protein